MRTIITTLLTFMTPLTCFAQKAASTTVPKIPPTLPSPIPNIGTLTGYALIGLIVVAVGAFLHGAILKLLQKANLYSDPLMDAIKSGIDGLSGKIDVVLNGITNLNGVYSSFKSDTDDLLNSVKKEQQTLLGVTSVLDQHIQTMRAALDHDTHGVRKISTRQRDMKGEYTAKIKDVQDAINKAHEDIRTIRGHIQNEVFKERQSKAFEAIHSLEKVATDISKAVQAGRDLPVGKNVPDTYCQAGVALTGIDRKLQNAVDILKGHRQDVDREVMTSIQTTVVLLEQLVGRVDRLHDRVQELALGDWKEDY